MAGNMFDSTGWEKVVYCKECKRSYTPCNVPQDGKPVIIARFCEITNMIVRDEDYCSCGTRKGIADRENSVDSTRKGVEEV